MPPTRLSALDASFLAAESPSAHMHVGWAAVFDPPADGTRPSFADLRDHVAARLQRAPRYRQRLASVPFGANDPVWVDEPDFDLDHHVLDAPGDDLRDVVDVAMSSQLERSRPLWELWIADELQDGRIAVVGKAHHCMVDGVAAVELASLLLDPEADAAPPGPDDWAPEPPPTALELLARGITDRTRQQLNLLRVPAAIAGAPRSRLAALGRDTQRAVNTLQHAIGTAAPPSLFDAPSSPLRHLATLSRPFGELREIKLRHNATVNDVVLAACSGGLRRFLHHHDQPAVRLKAMVPVSVRGDGASELGNRISFMFVELPCDEPNAVTRLKAINSVTQLSKRTREPQGADAMLRLAAHTPHFVQHALTRLVASPRTFNLVVSNIPGPQLPLYMRGCRLAEAYPIVPLAERHAVSIGVTTIAGRACFGIYADRKTLPDADLLARDVSDAIDELRVQPRRPLPRARIHLAKA